MPLIETSSYYILPVIIGFILVVEPQCPAWKLIVRHFGKDVLLEDGHIDRAKLGAIIFADGEKRRLLNSCTHPYIQREMFWQAIKCFVGGNI